MGKVATFSIFVRWKEILGIPCLAYGIAAMFLIKHSEIVHTEHGDITIYFLYPEDKGSLH